MRFIAISDNVDSDVGLSDMIPFSNLVNEWYAKDISKKMRAMVQQKGNSGKHLSTKQPYGYCKDELNKDKWLLDEYAAGIVKRIFEMFLSGMAMTVIADTLRKENVLRPLAYRRQINDDTIYDWNSGTIRQILVNQT